MGIVLTIVKLLIVLSIVATIHEFGHFLFAKLFKMTVNEFSIGFGPKLFQKKYKGTKYSLRWILLGGYVAIEGEEGNSEDKNAFSKKAPWKRIVVLIAGVTFNAILAAAIFLGVNLSTNIYGTKVMYIEETGVAYEAGLRTGDEIIKINDTKTHVYQDVVLYKNTDNKDVEVTYKRGEELKTILVKDAVKSIGYIGIYFDTTRLDENGDPFTYVDMVEPGLPASKAKIKSGDKILKVNGTDVTLSKEVVDFMTVNANKELEIVVLRGEKEITLKVVPEEKLSFNLGNMGFAPIETSLKNAYYKSISTISQIIGSYVDLFRGKVAVNQLSGIVGIGEVISKSEGVTNFINMLGMISLAIGIANILPFPPLDGGKVALVLIEWITKKRVSVKIETVLSYIGLGLLLVLTIYVTINDIIRIV